MKDQSGSALTDRQNIIFIDLQTIRNKLGTPIKELMPIEKWGLFFSYVDNEEYADYISELVRSDKGIMVAEKIVKRMSEADDNWYVQNSLYKAECDRNSIEYYAEKKGLEKGVQQQAEETAVKMLSKKFPVSEIVELTGLSRDQVLKLQKTHTDKA